MKNILARANREVLEQFVWSNVLLAFDYDGTLSPIVTDPDKAQMRKTTRVLLRDVAKHYRVIVISGRAQADAKKRLRGVALAQVVGNHGMEPMDCSSRHASEVKKWGPTLEACVAAHQGVTVENKLYSVAVHYRHSREKKKARAGILQAAAALGPVRIIGGKQVVNILPKGAAHKGLALTRERDRLQCDTAIYVGDDETDEDVFALDQPGRLLGIRVGVKRSSAATYGIVNQRAIDDLLRALLDLRGTAKVPAPARR